MNGKNCRLWKNELNAKLAEKLKAFLTSGLIKRVKPRYFSFKLLDRKLCVAQQPTFPAAFKDLQTKIKKILSNRAAFSVTFSPPVR